MDELLYFQDYLQTLIQEATGKATSIPVEILRTSKVKTDRNNLVFITTFTPNNKNVFPLIQTAFKLLQQSHETRDIKTYVSKALSK